MQMISISGTLLVDAEKCVGRNGVSYIRFDVTCPDQDAYGRTIYTHYHCTCYINGFDQLRKGDQVFISGKFHAKLSVDEKGKPYMNLNIMVYQITAGYRKSSREPKPIKA